MNNDIKPLILYGNFYANDIINAIKIELDNMKNKNFKYRAPQFAIIQIGINDASNLYIKRKKNIANSIGIEVLHYQFSLNEPVEDIAKTIHELNKNILVDGIILQLPIANKYKHLIYEIAYEKDIDGLGIIQQGNLALNRDGLRPCTPLGVINLLKHYNINFHQNMCLVGCSILVGQSLALMLIQHGATVTITHTLTKNLNEHIKQADIVFLAAGAPGLVTPNMLKNNAIVIDIGITQIDDKVLGDFAPFETQENDNSLCYHYTPVPKGIGPMTVASLMQNVFKAYKLSL